MINRFQQQNDRYFRINTNCNAAMIKILQVAIRNKLDDLGECRHVPQALQAGSLQNQTGLCRSGLVQVGKCVR